MPVDFKKSRHVPNVHLNLVSTGNLMKRATIPRKIEENGNSAKEISLLPEERTRVHST